MTKIAKKLLIGDKVKLARIRASMTQATLSSLAGIAQSHISEIEAGRRGVKAEQLFNIAMATKKPMTFFTTGISW